MVGADEGRGVRGGGVRLGDHSGIGGYNLLPPSPGIAAAVGPVDEARWS